MMNPSNLDKLKLAHKNRHPVNFVYQAESDGELRARFGTVTSVTEKHVTLYDHIVGAERTCILGNIRSEVRYR
jgi:hypothetical protein